MVATLNVVILATVTIIGTPCARGALRKPYWIPKSFTTRPPRHVRTFSSTSSGAGRVGGRQVRGPCDMTGVERGILGAGSSSIKGNGVLEAAFFDPRFDGLSRSITMPRTSEPTDLGTK